MAAETSSMPPIRPPCADQLPCGVFLLRVDACFTLLYANEFFYRAYGYTTAEAAEAGVDNCRLIVAPEDWPRVRRDIQAFIDRGEYYFELENRGVHRSGRRLWVLVRCNYNAADNSLMGVVFDITDRKRAEEALRLSEEENRIAIQQTDKVICRYDIAARTLRQPERAAAELGLLPEMPDMPESVIRQGIVARDSVEEYRRFYRKIHEGRRQGSTTVRLWSPARKTYRWHRADYTLVYDSSGTPLRAVISYYDCTELHDREIAYERWRQTYEAERKDCVAYYEYNLTDDIFEMLEGQVAGLIPEDARRSFSYIASYAAERFVVPEDRKKYLRILDREFLLDRHSQGLNSIHCEHRRYNARGEVFWALAEVQMIDEPYLKTVKCFVLIKDIDAQKRQALEMKRLSQYDALTGLFNRATAIGKITRILKHSPPEMSHTFAILDIDHFKALNDSLGHQSGDTALQTAAAVLGSCLRTRDFCGRLGGDEFIIFLRGFADESVILQRLGELQRRLSQMKGEPAPITVSLGVACYPRDGTTFQALYERADLALYEAKRRGRNQIVLYRGGLY